MQVRASPCKSAVSSPKKAVKPLPDLRRDDWVLVSGSLSFDGNTPTIKDARLQSDPLPAEKE